MNVRTWIRRPAWIALAIVIITFLHYATPTNLPVYHEVYNRLYYLPIILGAFFYGLRGGITVSVVVSLIFIPHIFLDWGGFKTSNVNMLTEVVIYNVVGAITGILISGEERYRRRLEETSERLRESLRQLEEKTNLLIQREEELRQSERLSILGEMSAMMAHEIRNPLGSIKGASEILSDRFKEDDDGYRYASILVKEVDRLNDVIDHFVRAGSMRRDRAEPVEVASLLEDVLFFFERSADQKGIEIETRFDPDRAVIQANPNQIRQVFMNLILNAVHALEDGGRLTLTTGKVRDGVEIVCSDSGRGIEPEAMSQIFKPFYTTRESGMGLGLAITKRIVEAHGGSIGIDSEVGKGTTVRVWLPSHASSS
jgi:signal transduction histidine kinase